MCAAVEPALAPLKIRIGVAGWDYPDWKGIVYPKGSGPRFDRLAYLARFVDALEINSTFYRPVDPRTAASWARRVAGKEAFRFTAKAHRSWTHETDRDASEVVPETLAGLAPLREAGLLAALLLQFPQSFHRTESAFARLERLLEHARAWPLVVELRHASWDRDEAAAWFRERDVGWCVVDQPRLGSAQAPARARATSRVGYLRLHGRNARDWFREDAGRDARYDYLYSLDELQGVAGLARTLAKETAEVFVIQNNHFRGQALVNAIQLKHLLDARPEAPPTLFSAYPGLSEVASDPGPEPGRLF